MSTLLEHTAKNTQVREFTPDAIAALIRKDLGLPADARVDFTVSMVTQGYGMGEHQAPAFTGVRVTTTGAK